MPSLLTTPGTMSNTGLSTSSSFTLVNTPIDPNDTFADIEGKDPAEQLDALSKKLTVQNRIKLGAEHMLNMDLTVVLRNQVESELKMANDRIDAINQRIQIQKAALLKRQNLRKAERDEKGPQTVDDFRTALQNAQSYLRTLSNLSRPPLPNAVKGSPSSSAPSHSPEIDKQRVDTMSKLIDLLRRNLRVRYEVNLIEVVHVATAALSDKSSKLAHAAAYRLIRHALVDADSVRRLNELGIEWYIVQSLGRDMKHAVEKEQVIKLIRAMIEIGTVRRDSSAIGGSGIVPLSEAVMRAVIAVAEQLEDPFRPICIQTLAEILVVDIDLLARTDGIRFLLHALADGPQEIAPIIASTFLNIIDSPRTRSYLHVGTDLEMALSAITDSYGKGTDHADRMRACARVILLMLRTWSGLMYFCLDDMWAIRSLIDMLRLSSFELRDIILDMFFELFNIRMPDWFQTFIDGRRLTMYQSSRDPNQPAGTSRTTTQPPDFERVHQPLKLTEQYAALLLLVFTKAGILEALVSMQKETATGSTLSRKATLLMAEILQSANRILPLHIAAQLQAIPEIFSLASDYGDNEHRIIGTLALSALDSFNRNRSRLASAGGVTNPTVSKQSTRPRGNSVEDAVRRGQRQVEQVKLKMSMQMDDRVFQASLLETQVMTTKDYTKWNFDVLLELIEGPLLNPKRMEETIKLSRFIRRLLWFFHPFSHRFSDIPNTVSNQKWVTAGCSLLTTLISTPDGLRMLSNEDPFLSQIMQCFAQLDPFNSAARSDSVFSKKRVADTLTFGYLEMLGALSRHKEGIELLEKFKIFTAFYHLSELRSREDLIRGIIENLDYSVDGHPRIVLSKALTSSYRHIRLYATRHLGELIRTSATANAWTLRLLLTQLYDPSAEVVELAVKFLEEACESKEVLRLVVELQPTMDHLGEIGHPLLMKFMSTPMGFRYLHDAGYIDREVEIWFNERNLFYVVQVEVFLSKVFNFSASPEDIEESLAYDGSVPPHFYGEMAKTELGSQVLQEKGHFIDFAHFIKHHGLESEDPDLIMKLKSVLWAVGSVGATEGGLPFLEEEEVIPAILDIAEHSPIPSVRGTCFFVLGLISSTFQGSEILDDYGWEATLSPLGIPTGLCIPADIERFVSIPRWKEHVPQSKTSRLLPPTSQNELEVITTIQNLANTVIANNASRSLARMRSKPEYKSVFSSPVMYYRALHIISSQRYRLPVRRYIMDLFNVELDQQVISVFNDCRKNLKAHPSYKPSPSELTRRASVFARARRPSESDADEDEEFEEAAEAAPPRRARPAISARPKSRIVGFSDPDI